jgi:hypothetical protein
MRWGSQNDYRKLPDRALAISLADSSAPPHIRVGVDAKFLPTIDAGAYIRCISPLQPTRDSGDSYPMVDVMVRAHVALTVREGRRQRPGPNLTSLRLGSSRGPVFAKNGNMTRIGFVIRGFVQHAGTAERHFARGVLRRFARKAGRKSL